MTRTADWTLAELVDFEHFLATADPGGDPALFEAEIAPRLGPEARHDRRAVLRAWVEAQRRRQAGCPTPGAGLAAAQALLARLAWPFGLLAGAGLSGLWFASSGEEPVNAVLFWVAVVGLQLLLLVLGGAAWLRRRRLGSALAPGGVLPGLLRELLLRLDGLLRRAPGPQRDALRAALGRIALRREHYGALLAAPLLALLQRAALAFNLGLLAAMLALHLPLADLRFGWQSTYAITPAQMHRAVQAVAAPWRWLLPQAQPTLEQVAATRYGRGQPAHTLPEQAARAWWPFLALSVACYGLLLRAALLLLIGWAQRRRLRRLRLDHAEANALWRRLAGPLVASSGGEARLPEGEAATDAGHAQPGGGCVALVAEELALDDAALAALLQRRYGWRLLGVHRVPIDDRAAAAALLEQLRLLRPRPAALAVVAAAGRDPIVAVAQFLRAVLAAADGAEVLVLLQPDPGADEAQAEERVAIWRRFGQVQRLALGTELLR